MLDYFNGVIPTTLLISHLTRTLESTAGFRQIQAPYFKTSRQVRVGQRHKVPRRKLNSFVRGKAYIMQEAWLCLGGSESVRLHVLPIGRSAPSVSDNVSVGWRTSLAIRQDVRAEPPTGDGSYSRGTACE